MKRQFLFAERNFTTRNAIQKKFKWRKRKVAIFLILCKMQFNVRHWIRSTRSRFVFSLKMHEERNTKTKTKDNVPEGAIPSYLLDREEQNRAKVLSNMIKQKRKEKAVSADETELSPTMRTDRFTDDWLWWFQGKWDVPLPKVKAQSEAEVFKVVKTGKTRRKLQRTD